jgi:hypothetical protein
MPSAAVFIYGLIYYALVSQEQLVSLLLLPFKSCSQSLKKTSLAQI